MTRGITSIRLFGAVARPLQAFLANLDAQSYRVVLEGPLALGADGKGHRVLHRRPHAPLRSRAARPDRLRDRARDLRRHRRDPRHRLLYGHGLHAPWLLGAGAITLTLFRCKEPTSRAPELEDLHRQA